PLLDFTTERGYQVVAVEVDLKRLVPGLVAFEALCDDVWIARGRQDRGQHVLVGADFAVYGARLDDARPAHDARYAPAAFPVRVLLAPERRRAAVGPSEHLGTVVRGPHHERVVGDAQVFEFLEQHPDHAVMLHHAVRVGAEARLALRLFLQMREDVHARGVEPA